MNTSRKWLTPAGMFGAVAVAAGAWSAHGLADNPTAQRWADTASAYQLVHAAVIVALSAWSPVDLWAARLLTAAQALFTFGVVLFCGTLYVLAAGGAAPFPGSAPLGGTALICGWLCVAVVGLRRDFGRQRYSPPAPSEGA